MRVLELGMLRRMLAVVPPRIAKVVWKISRRDFVAVVEEEGVDVDGVVQLTADGIRIESSMALVESFIIAVYM